jgi:phenylacetate-coenzyme A ligase PaaK-like adenylate-forming protein
VIFEPEFETLPREQLADVQLARLRAVDQLQDDVPLYRDRLDA